MKKRVLAIIPARHGSKRIKNKILKFFWQTHYLLRYKECYKTNIFNDIIVSTDSKKNCKISNKFGAKTPFLRSKNFLMIIQIQFQ